MTDLPERCRGSTRLPGCHSQVWWDLEGLFFQAARTRKKKRKRKKRTGNTKVSCPESVHCVEWDFCKHSLINTQSLNTFKSCALSYTIVTVTTKPALWFPHLVCSQFVYTWLIKIFYSHQVILHSTVHNKAAITGYQGWILRHPKIKVN